MSIEVTVTNPGSASVSVGAGDTINATVSSGGSVVVSLPGSSIAWDDVIDPPATFPPSSHTHSASQITDFEAAVIAISGEGPGAQLSDATPSNLGTAAAGTAYLASRADHVHALPSMVTSVNNLTGSLTLAAGNNVTITPSGSTLTIASTASGGGLDGNAAVDGGDYVGEILLGITFTTQPQNVTSSSTTSVNLSSTNVSVSNAVLSYLYGFSAYGNQLFSAGKTAWQEGYGIDVALMRSTDNGMTWGVAQTVLAGVPEASGGVAIDYSLSQIVSNGTRSLFAAGSWILYSDSENLSSSSLSKQEGTLSSVAWNGVRWVASTTGTDIGGMGGQGRIIYSSSDGVSWTKRFNVSNENTSTLANDGRLPVLEIGGKFILRRRRLFSGVWSTETVTSTDGVTWTVTAADFLPASWVSSGSRIVGISYDEARYTTNGTTWGTSTLPVACDRIFYAGGLFIATRSSVQSTDLCYSADGANWTLATLPASQYWFGAGGYGNSAIIQGWAGFGGAQQYARATIGLTYATANLTVAATAASGNPVSYQWQTSLDAGTSWSNVANATSSTLSLANLTQNDNGTRYRVFATATGAQSAYSQTALLTVTG